MEIEEEDFIVGVGCGIDLKSENIFDFIEKFTSIKIGMGFQDDLKERLKDASDGMD